MATTSSAGNYPSSVPQPLRQLAEGPPNTGSTGIAVYSQAPDANPANMMDTDYILCQEEILAVTTSKGKGSAGTFTITLSSSRDWRADTPPGTWCCIYISDQQLTGNETSQPSDG